MKLNQKTITKLFCIALAIPLLLSCKDNSLEKKLQSGDLIFQTSKTQQSKAIQLATHSKYSHVGIVYKAKDSVYVYEAVSTVKLTPLKEFIDRGEDKHFVVKRLKDNSKLLSMKNKMKIGLIGKKYYGKSYDFFFEWNDDRIYCSELAWKIFKEAIDVEIGELQTLNEFDLSNEAVKKVLNERYGDSIPLNERIISPVAMFNSDKLTTIIEN